MYKQVLKFVSYFIVIAITISVAIMLLWNWLIPGIFGLSPIDFWQALGLFALSRLLFGGFGRRSWRNHHLSDLYRNPIYRKWAEMNEEERADFIRNRHRRFSRRFYNNNPEK